MTDLLKPGYQPADPELIFDLAMVDRHDAGRIIDPGLAHKRGHHYSLDKHFCGAMARHLECVVLCQRDFAGFEPLFRRNLYSFGARSGQEFDDNLRQFSSDYRDDLKESLGVRIDSRDTLFIPSASIALLAGVEVGLNELPVSRRPQRIQLHFHTLPTHQLTLFGGPVCFSRSNSE